jgi:hypothetical protein
MHLDPRDDMKSQSHVCALYIVTEGSESVAQLLDIHTDQHP